MPSIICDSANPLPAGRDVTGLDLVVIDLDVTSNATAIKATDTGHILIRKTRSVISQNDGLQLLGTSSTVTNEGTIESQTAAGAAIRFAAGGIHTVNNAGTLKAAALVIEGNVGAERIINTGTLQTTSSAANAVLLDLKDGNDFYDGILGQATGGTIKLGLGNDTAYGGAGSEIFSGGEGDDYLNGGGDTVDYSDATSGISVDLSRTTSQFIGDGQGFDTLIDIENVTGSAKNDTIIGSTGNNTLRGGNGDDTLDGGTGNDRLEGGGGTNTARYSGFSAATVDLSKADAPQDTGGFGTDTLIEIANLEGGFGTDTFTGNDEANRLAGNGGNDTLDGGAGQDTAVFSGAGADYTITNNPDGTVTIADSQGAQRDGTDTLKDVRLVKFSDQTIALTNANPSNIFLSSSIVSEGLAVGATVATLSGSDSDGDALTFGLSSNPDGLFSPDSTGTKIILVKAFDYETATQHTVSVTAKDAYGGMLTKNFTITLFNALRCLRDHSAHPRRHREGGSAGR
jgi:Ca2+-binding RTX toxin-like protein